MSDDNNPFDDMVNAAQKMAQALNPSLASLSSKEFEAFIPQMPKELMELTFGNASNKDGLSAKSRLLLTLAGLTMQGVQAEAPLRLTVRSLLEAGAQKQEIKEAIAMMSVFAGVPAMARAMEVAQQMLEPKPEAGETT
jgi:4-carboxymuconolactone decarboxylase